VSSDDSALKLNTQIYDFLIINAEVLDGSGSVAIKQDLAIKGDRIVAIGDLETLNAQHLIDATGLVLAPALLTCIPMMI
jgi:N-acyl-D-aspartate/D-glutamate deacylase